MSQAAASSNPAATSVPIDITTPAPGVRLVRMARPEKKNALTGDMYNAMRGVIEGAVAADVRAVVFTGKDGVYTSGNDIADFMRRAATDDKTSPAGDFIKALATVEVPMIAAVDGLAIGVGTTMVLHMDLAYATARSTFRMPFVDLGLVPEAASSLLVPRFVGFKKATEYLMLCEPISAQEAAEFGLINAVVGEAELEDRAIAAAVKLAAKPKQALAITRRLIRGNAAELRTRIDEENVHFGNQMRSDEARQAFMAFMSRK